MVFFHLSIKKVVQIIQGCEIKAKITRGFVKKYNKKTILLPTG